MSIRIPLVAILCIFLGVTSCNKQDNIRIKLTSRERALIDTLYMEKIVVLRPYWDSMCELAHDSLLEIVLDSVISVRREEEAKLRSRIVVPGE